MRMTMPREFYFPKCYHLQPVDTDGTDAAIYTYETAGVAYAIGFIGKAAKPAFHHRYRNETQRGEFIAGFISGRKEAVEAKAKRLAERKAPHTLKVGDILVSSWGYEQTNIDFYQVTRIPGASTVEIREISYQSVDDNTPGGAMSGSKVAAPDAFIGEPMLKRVSADNWVKIKSYAGAHLWDGRPQRYSWYA